MYSETSYETLMVLNLALWAATALYFFRMKICSVYHPFLYYLAFHFLIFTFRPFLVYYFDYKFVYGVYQFIPSIEDKINALTAAIIGFCVFSTINLYVARTPIRFYSRKIESRERDRLFWPLIAVAVLLVPIGIYSLIESWNIGITGVSVRERDAATGVAYNVGSNGYIFEARGVIGPITVLFAWITRYRWYSFIPMAIFLILSGGSGTRQTFVLACLSLALLWLYENRQCWPKIRILAFAAGVLALFSAIGEDRGRAIRGLFVAEQVDRREVDEQRFLEGMDFANLEYMEYLTYVIPDRSKTYGYFTNNLQLLTEPIPRAIWKNKPFGEPFRRFYMFDYGYPIGMTRSLPGEGWYNLGYVGVVLWCGLFALLWGKFYESFARRRPSNLHLMLYVIVLPLSVNFFRDGQLISFFRFGVFMIFPVLLLHFSAYWTRPRTILSRRRRSSGGSSMQHRGQPLLAAGAAETPTKFQGSAGSQ